MTTPGKFDTLWAEKYRPKTLNDLVCTDEVFNFLKDIENSKSFPNILLYGKQGGGKTSIAQMICTTLAPADKLYINASIENGIDTVRNKIQTFAETRSIGKRLKAVILDEADGLSMDAQKSLKALMEEFSAHCRFILMVNNKNKLIAPLQSRCPCALHIVPPTNLILKRIFDVLKAEKVEYKQSREQIAEFCLSYAPDVRIMLHELQARTKDGVLNLEISGEQYKAFAVELFETAMKSPYEARTLMINSEDRFGRDYPKLLKEIFEHVYTLDVEKKEKALIVVANHLYFAVTAIDQEINAFACLLQLRETLRSAEQAQSAS